MMQEACDLFVSSLKTAIGSDYPEIDYKQRKKT